MSLKDLESGLYEGGRCGPGGRFLSSKICYRNSQQPCIHTGAKLWLFISFFGTFACLIAATWVMAVEYIQKHGQAVVRHTHTRSTSLTRTAGVSDYAGIAIFMQNVLIFLSSLLYKFGRQERTSPW